MELLLKRETPGILRMAAVDHVAERAHRAFGLALEPHPPCTLAVNHGDLLALAQIRDGLGARRGRHPIGDAAASPATVEAEHQPRPLGRAAMVVRIDAERAVGADQPRLDALQECKARPPDQRAIGEHPEVGVGGGIRRRVHARFIHESRKSRSLCYGQSGSAGGEHLILGNAAFSGFGLSGDSS